MEKIFYADKSAFPSSAAAVKKVLAEYFQMNNPKIVKTENGKPYLQSPSALHFSLSHTKGKLFLAFSEENVGIDAEALTREIALEPLLKKLSVAERAQIRTPQEFLRLWTVKEAAVKWLGDTLANALKKLTYEQGKLRYDGLELPVFVTLFTVEGHALSVCSEKDFSQAEFIRI